MIMTSHDKLKRAAFEAAAKLNGDKSVSAHDTWDDLGDLRDYIEEMMDGIACTMSKEDE